MLTSFAYILLLGLVGAWLAQVMKLPRLVGMLACGILIGPFVFNLLDPTVLAMSADLRKLALVIILVKAGLSLNVKDLKKVGRPALLMSFLPASFEILAYAGLAPLFFGISHLEALVMGAVLAAVSPAVVVPRMVELMDQAYGVDQGLPQMILAGSSCDDVFVIVLFTSFLHMAQGGSLEWTNLLDIPLSIILGILLGLAVGYLFIHGNVCASKRGMTIASPVQVILIFGLSFVLLAIESSLQGKVAVSGLLAIIAMTMMVKNKGEAQLAGDLASSFGHLWQGAELFLFVLVGAAVDIRYMAQAGGKALVLIILALAIRSGAVYLALLGTSLTKKERLYAIFAYLPKATVQAAIGGVPLAAGLPVGSLVLSVAVMAILLTAPLGAILMDQTNHKLLQVSRDSRH